MVSKINMLVRNILFSLTLLSLFPFGSFAQSFTEANQFDRPVLDYREDSVKYERDLEKWQRKKHKVESKQTKKMIESDRKVNQELIKKRVAARKAYEKRLANEEKSTKRKGSKPSSQNETEPQTEKKTEPEELRSQDRQSPERDRDNTSASTTPPQEVSQEPEEIQTTPRKKRTFMQKLRDSLF